MISYTGFPVRSLVITITVICLLAATLPALAQSSRLYFASYLGLSLANDHDFATNDNIGAQGSASLSSAPSFAGALGLRLGDNFRVEEELSYRKPKFDHVGQFNGGDGDANGSLRAIYLLTNLYYDINLKWHDIQPFISAGLGVAQLHGSLESGTPGFNSSGSSTNVAWQLGTGLKYRASPDLAFTGGYRYVGTSDADIGHSKLSFGDNEVRVGLEYDLPVRRVK